MTPKPEPRYTPDATLATMRAWHRERFAPPPLGPPTMGDHDDAERREAAYAAPIIATSSTGRTVLLDPATGEIIE